MNNLTLHQSPAGILYSNDNWIVGHRPEDGNMYVWFDANGAVYQFLLSRIYSTRFTILENSTIRLASQQEIDYVNRHPTLKPIINEISSTLGVNHLINYASITKRRLSQHLEDLIHAQDENEDLPHSWISYVCNIPDQFSREVLDDLKNQILISGNAHAMYRYAIDVMKRRWYEVEHLIKEDGSWDDYLDEMVAL